MSSTARHTWLVAALIIGFAALRLYGLGAQDLWLDETFTRLFALQPPGALWDFVVDNDMHPPLFFAYTRLFLGLGDQEFGLRFGGWLLGSLTLPLLYLAGRLLGGPDRGPATGLAALVIAGLSVNLLEISQDARAYVAMVFAMSLAMVPLAWLATRSPGALRPLWRDPASAGMFGLLALGITLLPWLHNTGTIYGAALGLTAVLIWAGRPDRSPALLGSILIAGALAVLLWLPHLPDFLRHNQELSAGFWTRTPSVGQVAKMILSIFGNGYRAESLTLPDLLFAAAILALGGAGALRLAWRRDWPRLALVLTVPVLFLAVVLTVSLLKGSIFLGRLFHPAAPPWILLLALSVAAIPAPLVRRAVLGVVALMLGFSQAMYFARPEGHNDWQAILATISASSEGRPTVLTLPNSAAVLLDYHVQKHDVGMDIVPAEGPYPAISDSHDYPTGWRGVPALTPDGLARLDAAIAGAEGDVWLMLRGHWSYDRDNILKARLDRDYCYRLMKLPGMPFFYFVQLVPLAQQATSGCVLLDDMDAFPYMAGRDGQIPLEGGS